MDIPALTTEMLDEPTTGEQWCVVDADGMRHIYGDQGWIKSHEALSFHPGGHVEHRPMTITYGDWTVSDACS